MKNIISLLTIFVSIATSSAEDCISWGRVGKGECLKAVKVGKRWGWRVKKSHLKNSKNDDDSYFIAHDELDIRHALPSTYESKLKQGKRCNIITNTNELFFKINFNKDNHGDKDKVYQGETYDNRLRDYIKYFDNFSKNDHKNRDATALDRAGFHKGFPKKSSERLWHSSDVEGEWKKPGNPEKGGKSTCSALGMCLCNSVRESKTKGSGDNKRKKGYHHFGSQKGCVPINNFAGIDEPFMIGGALRKRTKGNFPFDPSVYNKFSDTCYVKKSADSGYCTKTVRQTCLDAGGTECGDKPDICLVRWTCKLPPSETSYSMKSLPKCNHDLECGSKYCQRLPKKIVEDINEILSLNFSTKEKVGVCLPTAVCSNGCKEEGEELKSNWDYCCPGLVYNNRRKKCFYPGEILLPTPSFKITPEENSRDCSYEINYEDNQEIPQGFCYLAEHWENKEDCIAKYDYEVSSCIRNPSGERQSVDVDDSDDCNPGVWLDSKYAINTKYMYYSRLFEGLQWLWGTADSPGVNHMFGTYKKAKAIGEKTKDQYKIMEDSFYGAIDSIKNDLALSASSDGTADGTAVLSAMSSLYSKLVTLSLSKSTFYEELLGMNVNDNKYVSYVYDSDRIPSSEHNPKDDSLFKLLEQVNSRFGYLNDKRTQRHGTGRYNLAQGRHGCGIWGRRVWKAKNKFCDRNEAVEKSGGAHPNCDGWGDAWDTIRDGDCVKEGWRLDDPSGGFFGTEGEGGGILDGIYPSSLKSGGNASINLLQQKIKNYLNTIIAEESFAGTNRTEIGGDPTPISSGQLLQRITRDFKAFANEDIEMEGQCNGGTRKRIVSTLSKKELLILEKRKDKTITEDSLRFKNLINNPQVVRERYFELMGNVMFNFFVGFHYHGVPKWRDKGDQNAPGENHEGASDWKHGGNKKQTYRYFRDGQNTGEYNHTMELINAAIWLNEYHKTSVLLNRKISTCLSRNAEALAEALSSGASNSFDGVVGQFAKPAETFVNCSGNSGDDGGGGGIPGNPTTDADSSGVGIVDYSNSQGLGDGKKDPTIIDGSGVGNDGSGSSGGVSGSGGNTTTNQKAISGAGGDRDGTSSESSGGTNGALAKYAKASKKLALSRKKNKDSIKKELEKMMDKMFKAPTLQTVLGKNKNFGSPVASLAPIDTSVGGSSKQVMSDEEAEAYELLQALQAQNDGSGSSSDDLDFDDDDLEDVSSGGGGESGVDPDLVKAMEKNLEKYKAKEGDNLWKKISKTYMREGLRRLVRKRKIKNKKLPSLQKVKK